jgi:hypothetical protein
MTCNRLADMYVHHTTEAGVIYNRDGLAMEVDNVLLADNRVGLALLPLGLESIDEASIAITRAAVVGHSDNGGACFPDAALLHAEAAVRERAREV